MVGSDARVESRRVRDEDVVPYVGVRFPEKTN